MGSAPTAFANPLTNSPTSPEGRRLSLRKPPATPPIPGGVFPPNPLVPQEGPKGPRLAFVYWHDPSSNPPNVVHNDSKFRQVHFHFFLFRNVEHG